MIGRKKVLMGSILGSAAGLLWTLLVCNYTHNDMLDSATMLIDILKATTIQSFLFDLCGYLLSSICLAAHLLRTPWFILWLLIHVQSRIGAHIHGRTMLITGSKISIGAKFSITSTQHTFCASFSRQQ